MKASSGARCGSISVMENFPAWYTESTRIVPEFWGLPHYASRRSRKNRFGGSGHAGADRPGRHPGECVDPGVRSAIVISAGFKERRP